MARIAVMCLPDLIFAIPTIDNTERGTSLVPTRSLVKGNPQPMWVVITSEELETDSADYNAIKSHISFSATKSESGDWRDDDWYMMRLQTVISAAFRNLEADPNFKSSN